MEKLAVDLQYNKNHAKWFVTPALRAIHTYGLIQEGDQVCVGLSGGKDSVTLLYILSYLRRYSHLKYDLSAIHVRTSADYDTTLLRDYCDTLETPYIETALDVPGEVATEKVCSICARLKRGAAARALEG